MATAAGNPGWLTGWSLIGTAVIGLVGYFVTYAFNRRRDQVQARLKRVNSQLHDLYGPLLAAVESNERTWEAFRKKYHPPPPDNFWDTNDPPSLGDETAWHQWMNRVFMPNNLRMQKLVASRADLLLDAGMPVCLADLSAHISAEKALLSTWHPGERHDISAVPVYPKDLLSYIRTSFTELKRQQGKLLGRLERHAGLVITEQPNPVRLIEEDPIADQQGGEEDSSPGVSTAVGTWGEVALAVAVLGVLEAVVGVQVALRGLLSRLAYGGLSIALVVVMFRMPRVRNRVIPWIRRLVRVPPVI